MLPSFIQSPELRRRRGNPQVYDGTCMSIQFLSLGLLICTKMKNVKFMNDGEMILSFTVEGLKDFESDGVSSNNGNVRIALCCANNADEDLLKVLQKALYLFTVVSGEEITYTQLEDLLPTIE